MIKHSKGEWKSWARWNNMTHCVPVNISAGQIEVSTDNAIEDAALVEICKTAPHECDDPQCPGNINRRKLELFDEMLKGLKDLAQALIPVAAVVGPTEHYDPLSDIASLTVENAGIVTPTKPTPASTDGSDLEINHCLTLSTVHVTQEDMQLIDGEVKPIIAYPFRYGAFIYVPHFKDKSEEADQEFESKMQEFISGGYSEAFCNAMRLARENNCRFLNLDRDGETTDKLQVFEW